MAEGYKLVVVHNPEPLPNVIMLNDELDWMGKVGESVSWSIAGYVKVAKECLDDFKGLRWFIFVNLINDRLKTNKRSRCHKNKRVQITNVYGSRKNISGRKSVLRYRNHGNKS